MGLDSVPLQNLVESAVLGRLDIPEFQRGFVWRPDQVRALVDSLYRDYPIGLILAWDRPEYGSGRATTEGASAKLWLVDGQQRTTAACLLLGRRPSWWTDSREWDRQLTATEVLANITSEPPWLEFALANPVRVADPRWVSAREILSKDPPGGAPNGQFLQTEATAIVERLPSGKESRPDVTEVQRRLRGLWDIRSRGMVLATIKHDLEDVTEIFTRLNQQGTAVVEADVSLAAAASLHPGWVREEFLPFSKNLADSGFELEPAVLIRVLTGEGVGKSRLDEVPREFWSSPEFDASWQRTKGSLSATIGALMAAGVLSSSVIPSHNALIPLAMLTARYPPKEFNVPRALHWFLLANRDGRYSGASAGALGQDLRLIRESNSFPEALESLRGALTADLRIAPQEFMGRWTWNRPLLLITYLTALERKAMDWVTRRPLGQDRPDGGLEVGFVPYLHPFFPAAKGVLRSPQFDYSDEEVGALSNIVFLNQKPSNRSWGSSAPSRYVKEAAIPEFVLEQQLVPTERTLWEPDRYRDFLLERSKLLAGATNRYLASLLGAAR
jgi:uncharacterized protein DUF262